ncbi:hypothetical protein E4U55_004960 [Claviceps digitariae]|nr:hypothetical protein E4U55_004960 [Claviceps digitariae]
MKASNAALLLLTCHTGNVMAAPAAQANVLASDSKMETNALPLEYVNTPNVRDVSAKENSLDGQLSSFEMFGDEASANEEPAFDSEEEEMFVKTMLRGVFDILAKAPKDQINDLPKREEAVQRAVEQAAVGAQDLGLSKHLVTAFDKFTRDITPPELPGGIGSTLPISDPKAPLAIVIKAFFEAIVVFFAELKAAKALLPVGPGIPTLPTGLLPTGLLPTGLPIPSLPLSGLPTGLLPTYIPAISDLPVPVPGLPVSGLPTGLLTLVPAVSNLPVPVPGLPVSGLPTGVLPTGVPTISNLPVPVPGLPVSGLPTGVLPTGLPVISKPPVPSLPVSPVPLPSVAPKLPNLPVVGGLI